MKEKYKNYINNDTKFDKYTMLGIICLIIVIAGIIGFLFEFVFYYFNSGMKEFYYRGGNFLPWINIYAIGALLIYIFTYKYRKHPIKVFLISSITCGTLEFISGWAMYKFGNGFRCWDYNTEILNYGNIGGFVCLRSFILFGLASVLFIYAVLPICFYIARNMNRKLFLTLSISLCFIFLFDEFYNLIFARILDLPRASDIYKKIGFSYMHFNS